MGESIWETADRLRVVALESADARGYFAAMYARVTVRIGEAIGSGRFGDGEGMEEFACAFADHYLRALSGDIAVPGCWQASWEVADDPSLLIVQHLLLGINAHVNHDLALTVVDVADTRGGIDSIRPDFDAVNDVLAETYHDLIGDLGLVARWATAASRLGGGDAFNFSLRVARAQAWRASVAMFTLDEAGRLTYRAELDRVVGGVAYVITQPPALVRPLLWMARRLEEDDPPTVVRCLLGGGHGS